VENRLCEQPGACARKSRGVGDGFDEVGVVAGLEAWFRRRVLGVQTGGERAKDGEGKRPGLFNPSVALIKGGLRPYAQISDPEYVFPQHALMEDTGHQEPLWFAPKKHKKQ